MRSNPTPTQPDLGRATPRTGGRPRGLASTAGALVGPCLVIAACGHSPDVVAIDAPRADAMVTAQPGVLLIIADDLGAADVGVYAAEWNNQGSSGAPPTPVIDRLAREGVRFTTVWSNPVCSPTRAALYTGRNGFRTGVGDIATNASNVLALGERTIAESLPATYKAGLFGKWHVGATAAAGLPSPPGAQGWDVFKGFLAGVLPSYTRWTKQVFVDDGDGVVEDAEVTTVDSTKYATAEMVDEAGSWIRAQPQPWLAVLALAAPHAPFHVPPDPGTFTVTVDASCAGAAARGCYRAATEAMDTYLGRLLYDDVDGDGFDLDDPLRSELANTVVIFMGDNGPPGPVAPAGLGTAAKDTVYELGVRVPLIISGAGVAARGRVVTAPVGTIDGFATILDLTGGTATTGVDSYSLAAYLRSADGMPATARPPLYTEVFAGNDPNNVTDSQAAFRVGTLKLVKERGKVVGLYELTAPIEGANLLDPACAAGCACLRAEHVGRRAECDAMVTAMTALQTSVQ